MILKAELNTEHQESFGLQRSLLLFKPTMMISFIEFFILP